MKTPFLVLFIALFTLGNAQIINYSFESWKTKNKTVNIPGPGGGNQAAVYDDPNNWSSSNLYPSTTRFGNVSLVTKDTTLFLDQKASAKLRTGSFNVGGGGPGGTVKVPGILISGADINVPASNIFGGNLNIANIPGAGFPYNGQPSRFVGSYSLTNAGTDTVSCYAQLKRNGAVIATATFLTRNSTTPNTFSRFDVPFVYTSCLKPDTLVIILSTSHINRLYQQGGMTANTTLWVDSLGLTVPAGFSPTVPLNARNDLDTMTCVNNKQFSVLSNDDTCGSTGLTMSISTQSPVGVATVVNNQVDFTLNPGAPSGYTQVRYKICNSTGRCDSAFLNIYVANSFDARNDFDTLRCDSTKIINVRANDVICTPGSDTLSIVQQPTGGVALVINNDIHFVQAPGAPYGNTTIRYILCDKAFTTCDTATIFFNAAIPVRAAYLTDSLICDSVKTINLKALATICPKAQDTFIVVQQSNKGFSTFTGGVLNFKKGVTATFGNTTIQYAICDLVTSKCDTANVSLNVGGFLDAVNDNYAMNCDSVADVSVLNNDFVCPTVTDTLSILVQTPAGTASVVNKAIHFVRNKNAPNGNYQVRYLLCSKDKLFCDSAILNININNGNVNARDNFDTVYCLSSKSINILNNDSKSCFGTYDSLKIYLAPTSGTAAVAGTQITYTPGITSSGVQRFVYRVCDTILKQCDTASVYVYVSPLPLHTANNDNDTFNSGSLLSIHILKNDSVLKCSSARILSIKSAPLNGTATPNGDSIINYTPKPGFVGSDVFEYYVCYATGAGNICDSAKVFVTVKSSVSSLGNNNSISLMLWPNPATNRVSLKASENIAAYSIVDAVGNVVVQNICDNQMVQINTEMLASGMYYIHVKTLSGSFVQPLVIEQK